MKAISVLHIINGEYYSGAEKVQDLLAINLPKFGYDVALACIKPDKFPQFCQCNTEAITCFPMRFKFDFRAASHIAKYAKIKKIALIHTHSPRSAIIGRLVSIITKIPIIHHIHSPTAFDTEKPLRNFFNAYIELLCILGAKRNITVSESLKAYLLNKGIRPELVNVVQNGVPTPGPLKSRKPADDLWTIGIVALFRPRKGIEILLKALSRLREKKYRFRLRAVGPFESPDYKKIIIKLAYELNISHCIEWVGFSNNVNEHLAEMDIFVLPSLFGEGMPMVILEAMAVGTPVIGSKVEGVPEVVRDGKEGLLVNSGDIKELTAALECLISGTVDWVKLRREAYNRQISHFSDVAMTKKVAKIYDEVLSDLK